MRCEAGDGWRGTLAVRSTRYAIAWLLDVFERLIIWCYALVGATRVTSEEVLDIRAVNMAYIDVIVSDRRARDVLGFSPIVTRAQCMQQAGRRSGARRFMRAWSSRESECHVSQSPLSVPPS